VHRNARFGNLGIFGLAEVYLARGLRPLRSLQDATNLREVSLGCFAMARVEAVYLCANPKGMDPRLRGDDGTS